MEKFVSHQCSGSEFVYIVLYPIIHDRRKSSLLKKDFKKQERLELKPKIFQFSKIISDLQLPLQAFDYGS
jgi:hypothetical protein